MHNPLVSIVVPIYKVEKYLERCLDSIIAQSYRPLEVILVNDGSPDGCGEIIRRYEERWPIFRSIWQENRGLSAARNAGIDMATGTYLALIDSDDFVEPDFIDSLVRLAESKGAQAVICNFYFNFQNGIKIPFPLMTLQKNMTGEEAAAASIRLLTMPTFIWNKLYRLELFKEKNISFPAMYYEDMAILPRLLVQARKVAVINRPLYHYCLRRTGITGNFRMKNVTDYLQAVEMVRQFVWEENLWDSWKRHYRMFLLAVETHLMFAIHVQKNSIPISERRHLTRQIHHRLQLMALPPDPAELETNQGTDLSGRKKPLPLKMFRDLAKGRLAQRIIGRLK